MSDYIIKIEPNHRPRLVECDDLTLEYMQTMVEGDVEVTDACRDLQYKYPHLKTASNADGKFFGLEGNLVASILHSVAQGMIYGPALLIIEEDGERRPMTEAEATDIRETIEHIFNIEFEEGEEE